MSSTNIDEATSMNLEREITMSNQENMMIQVLGFEGIDCYLDQNSNKVMILADDVARELGFGFENVYKDRPLLDSSDSHQMGATCGTHQFYTSNKIRWNRINKYLSQYGLPPVSSGQYMDEDSVIYLAIKANNLKARAFHRRLVEIIIPYFKMNVSMDEYNQMRQQIREQQELIDAVQPAIHMYHEATNDDAYITIQQIADSYGMTAQGLNALLYKLDFHRPVNGGWVLNKPYRDEGLVCTKKRQGTYGEYDFTIGYTEKGRVVIDKLLHDHEYQTKKQREQEIDERIQAYNERVRNQRLIEQQPQIINNTYNYNYYQTPPPINQPIMQYGDPNNCPIQFVSDEERQRFKTHQDYVTHLNHSKS